jgi:hypothetical protein
MLATVHVHGALNQLGSFRADDMMFLSSFTRLGRVQRALTKLPVNIDLHFVHLPWRLPYDHMRSANIGFLTPQHVKNHYRIELKTEQATVTTVLVQNEGSYRLPFTPWLVIHRLAHCFTQSGEVGDGVSTDFRRILLEVSQMFSLTDGKTDDSDTRLVPFFGTTNAARKHNYPHIGEWFHDCFAQLYMTGAITFNPAKRRMTYRHTAIVLKHDLSPDMVDNLFKFLANRLKLEFDQWLKTTVGRIVVL